MKKSRIVLFSHKREPEKGKTKNSVRRIRMRIIFVAVMLALISGAAVLLPQRSFAVSLNGQVVGAAKNVEEVEKTIDAVEEKVSEILGYEFCMDGEVELKSHIDGAENGDLTEAFLENIEEIEKVYILEIDGIAAASSEDESTIRSAIEAISTKYAVKSGSSVSFDNRVAITFGYAPKSIAKNADEMVEMLDPDNVNAEFPLSVRTVVKETHEETLPYGYEYVDDSTAYEGTETVVRAGAEGNTSIVEQVVYLNGTEQTRTELSSIVLLQPVTEQVSVGTMFRPRYVSYGTYIWPAQGAITCYFGYRNIGIGSNNHQGMDIGGSYRSDIIASDGGEVIFAENVYSYGNLVKIQHDNGDVTWYAHCDEILACVGDKVAQGDTIALMGTTGVSTGVHLHFEVHTGGAAVDPLTVLP